MAHLIDKSALVAEIDKGINGRNDGVNNIFISSAKKDEAVENFVKSKREELEKMIPGFINDRKFTDIVLNFYERGIRDGAQMMLEQMTENALAAVEIERQEVIERAIKWLEKNTPLHGAGIDVFRRAMEKGV